MKTLLIATALLASTAAMAETYDVTPYVSLERETKAEINNFTAGAAVELPYAIVVDARVNTYDPDSEARFEFETAELDITAPLTEKASLYMKNDFDSNWDHAETTVGVKVTF